MLFALIVAAIGATIETILASDESVQLVAVLIPLLTTLTVAPDGSNRMRLVVAVLAAGALAVGHEITAAGGFDLQSLGVVFVKAAVSSQVAYKMFQAALGDNVDLNDLGGSFGIGRQELGT